MTTLPQTTPMRMSRPAGVPMVGPGGGMPAGPGGPGGQGGGMQLSAADIWRILRSNLWLILLLVAVAAGIGYGVNQYLSMYHSRYTAAGLIQIQSNQNIDPLNRRTDNRNDMNVSAELSTQVQLLRQESLYADVLKNSNSEIRKTGWFRQFPSPAQAKEHLVKNFEAAAIPDTRLIRVRMTYRDPKESKTILEEVVNQHLENQQRISREKEYERSVLLTNLKVRYEMQLKERSEELRAKAMALAIDGASGNPSGSNAKEQELTDLIDMQIQTRMNAEAAQRIYDDTMGKMQQGIDPAQVEGMVSADEDVKQFRNAVDSLEITIEEYKLKLGPKNKEILQLEKRKQMYEQKLEQARQEVAARARSQIVEQFRQMLQQAKDAQGRIDERVQKLQADIGELTNQTAQYLTLKDEERALRELLKQVKDQLDDFTQTRDRADTSNVQWVIRPPTPDSPSFPKLGSIMSIAIALAVVAGLGIAFLRELMDTSVRSPRDIAKVGQMNLLGIIPHEADDPQSVGARLPLVIFEAPHSMTAEQFRQVRTRLQHAASLDTTRTLLVTSPSPGDGKTTVACNLAAGLALIGRRILLVDANFRRPELHKTFGVSNEQGFSTALGALDTFESSVLETPVPNLSVLPSGPKPANPTELLESQLMIDFIERALEEYDHVIFDSGPLLFVSESVAMAPRVDGVVTVVRARSNTRGLLQRMRDGLRQVKAEHLGVVLNAVRAHGGGYYGRNIKTYYAYQNGHE